MSAPKKQAPRFRVGDWVSLLFGPQRVLAEIVEDRGPIGVRGRRLYRIRLEPSFGDSFTFEMPEALLEPAAAPEGQADRTGE